MNQNTETPRLDAVVLLPCPFCGGDAICHEVQGHVNSKPEFYTTCVFETCCGYHSESEGIWRSESDAVQAWNRRDGDTCHKGCKITRAVKEMNDSLTPNY